MMMQLPTILTGDEPIKNVPGALPSLWQHQSSALQRMYAFEQMVQAHGYSENMPLSTPRGIVALPPGAGKSRVVLALCLSEPRINTIIVVLPSMVDQWLGELASVGIHKGDQYVRVISNLQSHYVLNASVTDYRIVYDETESLKNAAGKPATKFTHEHDMSDPKNKYAFPAQPYVIWLLDGSYDVQNQVSTHHVQSWSMEEGPLVKRVIHVPHPKGGAKAAAFGLDYFPINVIQCDPEFVTRSQQLNLMAPTIHVITMNDQLAHLTFLNDANGNNNMFATCVSIKDVAEYCKTMQTELNKEIRECDDVLHRFDDDLLLNIGVELMSLNDDAAGGAADRNGSGDTLSTSLGMNNRSIKVMVDDAKERRDKARGKLNLLDKLVNDDQKCAICWSQEIIHPPAISPCCYTRYCYYCIHPWVSNYNSCPICRKVLTLGEVMINGDVAVIENVPVEVQNRLPMHPFAVLEQFAILPARRDNKLVLVYFDDTRRNRKDIEDHINFCVRTYDRDLCCSALRYPSALRELAEDKASPARGRVLFITESVGLKGLNLCAADHVIVMSKISSSKMTQLLGRVQRPGRRQNHPLIVYTTTTDTE